MATEILRPHDCLRTNQSSSRCGRRKRSPSDGNRRSNRDSLSSSPPSSGLVMGKVKILKRGEDLKAKLLFGGETVDLGLQLSSTDRLGPDADVVQKQVRVSDLYAGTNSMVSSPHPSSLPFPSTLVRRNLAEHDLRKMLKM
ncbi:Helicase POLQ-like [Bienertia sinuspersici]